MNKSHSMLTKTCSNCGQQKPLSAFLEMSGTHGAAYGNICMTCRKTAMDKQSKRDDHETTSTTGTLKIDAKAKVFSDIDKKQRHQLTEELNLDEKLRKDDNLSKNETRSQNIKQEERKHRNERLKKSFLDKSIQPASSHQHIAGSQGEIAERGEINLTTSFIDTGFGGKKKFQSVHYLRLRAWLGNAHQFVSETEKATQKLDPNEELVDKSEKEIVDRLSGPSSRRK